MKAVMRMPFAPVLFAVLLIVPSTAWAHGMSAEHQRLAVTGGYLDYLWLGAQHMLTGYDHLLFLFGVMFFLTRFSSIVKFITAFTVGHCLTLVFATYLRIHASYFLIDAVIALTVCYKGFENLNGFKRWLGTSAPNLVWMVFAFGLIHGLGLSTRLQQLPLGQSGGLVLFKVLSFNVGVELGQIAALVVMMVILAGWRHTASFKKFSSLSNAGLIFAGLMLFLMQMHGYVHQMDPEGFGFNEDAHYHVHERMAKSGEGKAL